LIAIVGARAMRANGRDRRQRDGDDDVVHRRTEHRHEDQAEDQGRKGQQHVHRLHDDRVGAAAMPSGEHPDRRAEQHREKRGGDADDERDPRAVKDPRKRIAAEAVGAEPVLGGRRTQLRDDVLIVGIVGRQHGRGDRERDDREEHQQADP
jgi:hypothetical protein